MFLTLSSNSKGKSFGLAGIIPNMIVDGRLWYPWILAISSTISSAISISLDLKEGTFTVSEFIPQDTHKFYIKNSSGNNIALFSTNGDIFLKGKWMKVGECSRTRTTAADNDHSVTCP